MRFLQMSSVKTETPTLSGSIKGVIEGSEFEERFEMPRVGIMKVDGKLDFRVDLQVKNPRVVSAVFWCNNKPKNPTVVVANSFYNEKVFPRNRVYVVSESSEYDVSVKNTYEFIHQCTKSVLDNEFSSANKVLICVDPKHELPIILRMAWPNTKIVCVFSKAPRVAREYLREVDCVIGSPEVVEKISNKDEFPLLLAANTLLAVSAHIKAFLGVLGEPHMGYYYSMNGRDYGAAYHDRGDLVVITDFQYTPNLNIECFREYAKEIVRSSEDILIHSRWIYQFESFIENNNWLGVVLAILNGGGKISFMPSRAGGKV